MLSHAESDMKNLLNSTNIGTIFLDKGMRVKRFTSEATRLINLINSDIGRPLEHIVTKFKYDGLISDIQKVNETLVFIEKEVETIDGYRFLMRILPYRTNENLIDGVVMTFIDITSLSSASKQVVELGNAVKAAIDYADSIIHIIRIPLIVLNEEFFIITANQSFYSKFNLSKEQTINKSIFNLANKSWNVPEQFY
jgi:two-component system CheB/CheR fusion protein